MRYLIVGFGNIGHKRQAVLKDKCVAIVDPDPRVKASYKSSYDVPLDIFDAAVLTVPQQYKIDLVRYFLSKGKHVLVEKPLVISFKMGQELFKLAKKNNVIWYTSYNHRFEPNINKVKRLLEEGVIGKIYHGRMVYSFGNIKERIGTWRETKYGVLEEIAPHLIDLCYSFFDYKGSDFKTITARKVESSIFDHWVFSTSDFKIIIEISAITWKNVFSIDLYGSLGSIHINGLNKWQGSRLIIQKRVFPSGAPSENHSFTQGPDQTWKKDFQFFESQIKQNKTSVDCDLYHSLALASIALGAPSLMTPEQDQITSHYLKDEK